MWHKSADPGQTHRSLGCIAPTAPRAERYDFSGNKLRPEKSRYVFPFLALGASALDRLDGYTDQQPE
jgi:hypothetical protein